MKTRPYLFSSRLSIPRLILISSLVFLSVPGGLSTNPIILRSISIYSTHEFLAPHPTIYFRCKGEKKILLPDVKEKHFLYTFKGQEPWQPLTDLPSKKCKRCGLYEYNRIESDDVLDEWELCEDDFVDGTSVHYKQKEFNATLGCEKCKGPSAVAAASQTPNSDNISADDGSGNHLIDVTLVVAVSVLVSVVVALAITFAYKYWQKKKREHNQARFLKLFEEGDDIEEEFGLRL